MVCAGYTEKSEFWISQLWKKKAITHQDILKSETYS